MASDESVIDWLLAGDSAVRWQVMRDLLGEPAETWERKRTRTLETGCVAELLGYQEPDGEWNTLRALRVLQARDTLVFT